ncbi:YncE family protein [Acetobacter orientalis]|uniref:Vgb family protein n=1 Tax=Acetobacter orientalis TaxID=146474 RepID=UPI0039EA0BBA
MMYRKTILKYTLMLAVFSPLSCFSNVFAQTAPMPQVMHVPGSPDFLAVNGSSVWVMNRGRVERWSTEGKLAEVKLDHPCGAMAVAFGSLWVADCKAKTLNRVNLQTAKNDIVIQTGIANPRGELNVVSGDGSIWVGSDGSGKISRVDPLTNKVIASIPVDSETYYLAFGFGALWGVSPTHNTLQKIDPQTNSVVKKTALGQNPGFLVAGEGAVWVQEQGDGTLVRIAPETGEISGRVKVDNTLTYGDIDAGGGKVWLRTTDHQTFVVVDPKTLAIRARLGTQTGSGALRYTPQGIWTTSHDIHVLAWWEKPENIGN